RLVRGAEDRGVRAHAQHDMALEREWTRQERAVIEGHRAATLRSTRVDRSLDRIRVIGDPVPGGPVGVRIAWVRAGGVGDACGGDPRERHADERAATTMAGHGAFLHETLNVNVYSPKKSRCGRRLLSSEM